MEFAVLTNYFIKYTAKLQLIIVIDLFVFRHFQLMFIYHFSVNLL